MLTRREIIQAAMAFSAWPVLRPSATAPRIPGSGAPEDETYWAYVRSEFELAPEFTNLASVVRGSFTKANREISFDEATRLNRLPATRPDLKWQEEVRKNDLPRREGQYVDYKSEHFGILKPGYNGSVRRALAISLMLIFGLPLVSSLWSAQAAPAGVPACCRRGGEHHCTLSSEDLTQGSGQRVVSEKCPYTPTAPAVVLLPSFTPSPAAMIFAGITRHPAISPQTDAQLRISFDRSRQKRGPPTLLV